MTNPVIVDAGPALNFMATKQERILLTAVGPKIAAPETVRREVLRKATHNIKFETAATVWARLEHAKRLDILSDDVTPELNRVVQRLSNTPMADRLLKDKDLGETLVIAHAVVHAEAGARVIMLIDEIEGARAATAESNRLRRLAVSGKHVGSLTLYNTHTVLKRAAGSEHLKDKNAMRTVYDLLREHDAGLVHINQTDLLGSPPWP